MDVNELKNIASDYEAMQTRGAISPQKRGQLFDEIVGRTFRAHGCRVDIKKLSVGEIDVAIEFAGQRYILEAKWEKKPPK